MSSDISEWAELTRKAATLLDPRAYVERFFQEDTRPDGRLFLQARQTVIQQTILPKNSAGSALVTYQPAELLDNNEDGSTSSTRNAITSVLAAVTLLVGQPTTSPECPEGQGDVVVQVTSADDEGSLNVTILQSFLQRILDVCVRDAQSDDNGNDDADDMETDKDERDGCGNAPRPHPLVIVPGSAAIRLVVTVHILQDAGNMADAALLACMAALSDVRIPCPTHGMSVQTMPRIRVWWQNPDSSPSTTPSSATTPTTTSTRCCCCHDKNGIVTKTSQKLKFPVLPIALTMGLWDDGSSKKKQESSMEMTDHVRTTGKRWIVDPSRVEEACLSTVLTMVVNGNAPDQILLMDTSTGSSKCLTLNTSDLALASQIAAGRAKEVLEILQGK